VLLVGIDSSELNKLIDYYGAVEGELSNEEFTVKEMLVEDQYYLMLIEFWIPINTSLESYKALYEKSLKDPTFTGVIMVCSHKESRGTTLKQGVDYLGELY
jgi:hypothetical protein